MKVRIQQHYLGCFGQQPECVVGFSWYYLAPLLCIMQSHLQRQQSAAFPLRKEMDVSTHLASSELGQVGLQTCLVGLEFQTSELLLLFFQILVQRLIQHLTDELLCAQLFLLHRILGKEQSHFQTCPIHRSGEQEGVQMAHYPHLHLFLLRLIPKSA